MIDLVTTSLKSEVFGGMVAASLMVSLLYMLRQIPTQLWGFLSWSVANQEETALLRVGWRMFLMAHERWPEKYPDNPKNIWVPTNAATFTFGDPGNVVLYEHEELAKQAAADSGGKVVPVSFGAAP